MLAAVLATSNGATVHESRQFPAWLIFDVRRKRMLTNALIRIEGRRKALPAPFELVGPPHVWVLDFAVPKRAERDQLRWLATALAKKKALLSRHSITKGAILHLAFSSKRLGPHLLDPSLLRVIAGLELGLEVYEHQSA